MKQSTSNDLSIDQLSLVVSLPWYNRC